jgi:magnesium chelatase family protein
MGNCEYPCPCGYWGDPTKECTDSLAQVLRYQNRLSGPLLDRIDIHVEVPRVDYEKLSSDRMGEPSAKIRERVGQARQRQQQRFVGTKLQCNGDMGPGEVRRLCIMDNAGRNLLRTAMQQMQLSARAYHRILKLERTIADLTDSEEIETAHIAGGIQYRPRKQIQRCYVCYADLGMNPLSGRAVASRAFLLSDTTARII